MKSSRFTGSIVGFLLIGAVAAGAFFTREQWLPLVQSEAAPIESEVEPSPVEEPKVLKLSAQARKNLSLIAKPVVPQTYWRKIQVPGEVVDRPGRSDRGVTSPAVGVISQVHAFPGETVRPGDKLFTVQLFSEYLQNTQKELFSASKEIQLIQEQLDRLGPLAESGGIAGTKIIDLNNQLRRQEALIQSHRQDLLTRGLSPSQIQSITEGKFISTVEVVAPPPFQASKASSEIQQTAFQSDSGNLSGIAYEVQDLRAELGQQVQAGQLLSTLSDHSSLYVEGHAFKREAPYLENAAQLGWSIHVEFAEDVKEHWPPLQQEFQIRYISNAIDTESRTFDFFIPLQNQARAYQKDDETFVVWRFRPGQRVRLHVPVEELTNVIVLPSGAVVREGPEAFVFQQNGSLFNRIPVHVLHEDRVNTVIANDGSITPGLFFAQSSAASLNRILKSQAASGMRADVHVHADGTVHAAH
ncbi:efflux RND transporter periplasmic adaptor subunit [Rubinisphaera margarita]|uniref:efflux RND transporter periplasmic adaptor subunit n=1 Tax=Rubinisphaera margarita TaxID=2909586 RepID=UPI001EE88A28|nr:efflux RND transporter periplasmic adaptor subunit [Rubinisphaera margarita]MCG6156371.1 efflux RND transporter periplasmic adaptor subunit [Rubinisphaera margarita]